MIFNGLVVYQLYQSKVLVYSFQISYTVHSPIEEIWHHCNCNLATYMMSSCTCFKYLIFWQQLAATDKFIPLLSEGKMHKYSEKES